MMVVMMMIDHQDKYVEQHIEISISSSFPPLIILTSALFVLISVSFLSSSFCPQIIVIFPQIIVISSSRSFSFCLQIILISSSRSAASSHWHGSLFFVVVFVILYFLSLCLFGFVFVCKIILISLSRSAPSSHWHGSLFFVVVFGFVFFCLCVFLSLSLSARSSSFHRQDQQAPRIGMVPCSLLLSLSLYFLYL